MRPNQPPQIHTLPELPYGCDELQATADPDSDTRLRAHLDCLPGLGLQRANLLSTVAIETTSSAPDDVATGATEPVLGLEDLLRTRTQGCYTLHPRVQQIVSVGALDSLLETVANRLDKRLDFIAYQYPQYLFECRGAAPDQTALHPPEYHIRTLEVAREIRANDLLVTICRPGDPLPGQDTIRSTLDSMDDRGETPCGVFTLLLQNATTPYTPILVFHDDNIPERCPGQAALFDHMRYLCDQYRADMKLKTISEFPQVMRDD
jgi:hypothetical protein